MLEIILIFGKVSLLPKMGHGEIHVILITVKRFLLYILHGDIAAGPFYVFGFKVFIRVSLVFAGRLLVQLIRRCDYGITPVIILLMHAYRVGPHLVERV